MARRVERSVILISVFLFCRWYKVVELIVVELFVLIWLYFKFLQVLYKSDGRGSGVVE